MVSSIGTQPRLPDLIQPNAKLFAAGIKYRARAPRDARLIYGLKLYAYFHLSLGGMN